RPAVGQVPVHDLRGEGRDGGRQAGGRRARQGQGAQRHPGVLRQADRVHGQDAPQGAQPGGQGGRGGDGELELREGDGGGRAQEGGRHPRREAVHDRRGDRVQARREARPEAVHHRGLTPRYGAVWPLVGGDEVPVVVEQVFHVPGRSRTVVRMEPKGQKQEVLHVVNGPRVRYAINGTPVPTTDAAAKDLQHAALLLEVGQLTPLLTDRKFT